MWPNFDGKPYTRAELAAHINACDFSKWKRKDGLHGRPAFITLHNTSSPDLKLWLSWSPQKRRQYIVNVQDYLFAVGQVAQTSLRSMIGKSELDDLLSNREELNKGLEVMIDSPALSWGIHIDRVEIKDVALPDTMKRSMARQASRSDSTNTALSVASAAIKRPRGARSTTILLA